jgi:peptidoglycan/xylan/chitin deacetylase (PgdA/CDA1 family)
MKALALLYHDVVDSDLDSSGFPGGGPARYKLSIGEFERHLDALAAARPDGPVLVHEIASDDRRPAPLLLTFDDGGASAVEAANILDRRGWRAHFLITVQPIGSAGFVTQGDIRDLRRRGHVVGSHSFSHPDPMSGCAPDVLREEWSRSVQVLQQILGEEVRVASVPGGAYSREVARAAAFAGIRSLFTSEPITRSHDVDGCLVLGRYTLLRGTSPRVAGRIARGMRLPRLAQLVSWNARKAAKRLAGRYYRSARSILLAGRERKP